ncbi:MAG: hypothetical protein WBD40_08645 [Tepidisphaeraceae bacterium]
MTLIAALCVALLIYLAVVALVVQRINRMIHVTVGVSAGHRSTPTIRVEDGQVHFLGRAIPLIAVISTTAIPPVWWLAATIYDSKLRRTREQFGQCLQCGQTISGKRGRCPRCGERFERSRNASCR